MPQIYHCAFLVILYQKYRERGKSTPSPEAGTLHISAKKTVQNIERSLKKNIVICSLSLILLDGKGGFSGDLIRFSQIFSAI
jgi:hypothetical protein